MRRRLEQLLNETFEYESPRLVCEPALLEGEADSGEVLRGSVLVHHPEGKRCRGFVYSSNPRLAIDMADFYSPKAEIHYQVDLTGLKSGQKAEGTLTICSDLGELSIPYCFVVKEEQKTEQVLTIDALADLARTDFAGAAEVYSSKAFGDSLEKGKFETFTIWKALSGDSDPRRALEQFLIAEEKKEMIELSLAANTHRILNPVGTVLEEVVLTKSTWGYMEIEVSSDSRFLRVEKKTLTTEDFIGSQWPLRYIVDTNFLHAGRNLGRITVRTCYQTLAYEVCVEAQTGADHRTHRVQNVMIRKAMRLYIDYRLGRIDLRQWTERTHRVIESYNRAGGDKLLSGLLEVFVLQAEGKRSPAEIELHKLERNPHIGGDPNAQAAWLYLSTFFVHDEDYRMQVRERMRTLYLENRSSWLIRWLTMYILKDELGEDAGKLDLIIKHIEQYDASPILLLEAVQILRENPFLCHEWTLGTRMIINWAVKEQVMDERLVLHSMNLIRRKEGFDEVTFRMLDIGYRIQILELGHDEFPDLTALDRPHSSSIDVAFDPVEDRIDLSDRNRAFIAGPHNTRLNLTAIILLARIILFDHNKRDCFNLLISRKTLPTLITLSPSPDRIGFLYRSGVRYSCVITSAKRTLHTDSSPLINYLSPVHTMTAPDRAPLF